VADDRTRWLDDHEQEVWRRLLAVESRLHEQLDRELMDAHCLSAGDYGVLVHLSEASGGELRMSDLAERLLLSRSGLTRRIDGLVKAGLVTRRSCPSDRRGALAQLTPAGWERLRQAAPTHVAGVRKYLIDALGDLDGLSAGLDKIERALPADRTQHP
jgi:DNA-binding MarR family transcriptional regulator